LLTPDVILLISTLLAPLRFTQPLTDRIRKLGPQFAHMRFSVRVSPHQNHLTAVDREPRRQEVVVHHGTIASGNQVIKDAAVRDKLSAELGGMLCAALRARCPFSCVLVLRLEERVQAGSFASEVRQAVELRQVL
jgi:hypothetical protein